jgi:hypothetical protein
MQAAGVFLDSTGIPTLPDGTPYLPENRAMLQFPTVEQQNQQVANAVAQGYLSQNAEYQNQLAENRGILDVLGTTLGYGLGPPYTPSDKAYSGTPMEANADWDAGGFPTNWQDYSSNNISTGGGFFAFDELYHGIGQEVPWAFQSGSNMPSTNNYRLLPPEYRKPNYIMRNGQIIDMNAESNYGPFGRGEFGGGYANPSWRSGAAVGMPVAWAQGPAGYGISGWPGQLSPYVSHTGWLGLGGAG